MSAAESITPIFRPDAGARPAPHGGVGHGGVGPGGIGPGGVGHGGVAKGRAGGEGSREAVLSAKSAQSLVESCQGLVRTLAWKIHRKLPPAVELEDLIAYGQVGLAQAARDYDPERSNQFVTYAYYRIRGAILDGLSKMSWFSRHDYYAGRYEQAAVDILEQNAAQPASTTVAEEVDWFANLSTQLSVARMTAACAGGDVRDEGSPSPLAAVMDGEVAARLHLLIDALPSDASALIRLTYFEGLTLQEAGSRIGVSRAWASRLHAKTLQRLGRALRLMGVTG